VKIKRIVFTAVLIMILSFFQQAVYAQDAPAPLATGDGITVNRSEMDLLQKRYSHVFRTTEGEYCRALLKMKLFAKEARLEKLDQSKEFKMMIDQVITDETSKLYMKALLSKYPISDQVIQSYFLSHPEEFTEKGGAMMLLDAKLKAAIREKLIKLKQSEIINAEYARLKSKYHVVILDPMCSEETGAK
jgi:hypothetical protein